MIPLPKHPALSQGLRSIKGVGPQMEKALNKRGYKTCFDLLSLMPTRYQDRRTVTPINQLAPDREALVTGLVAGVKKGIFPKSGRRYFELVIDDGTGRLAALWFNFPAHHRHTLAGGKKVYLFGQVSVFQDRRQMVHPELVITSGEPPRPEIRPVYPEMAEVKAGSLRRIMAEVRREIEGFPRIFPTAWLERHGWTDPVDCLRTLHQPPADSRGRLPRPEESRAWRNLAFFELLFLQLILAHSRIRQASVKSWICRENSVLAEKLLHSLPFNLTLSQTQALADIRRDLASARPMNRLLQGDVGSGKTVVALAAAFTVVDGGRQAAIMAPTEVLARQLFRLLAPSAQNPGLRPGLLVGGLTEKEKAKVRTDLATGRVNLVVGTQALIADSVSYQALGLVVIDEQHRFGVAQRLALRAKAEQPNILVMTATPIPRSLALTLYGDLDLTVIKGLPPGRQPVKTLLFSTGNKDRAYQALAKEIMTGGRGFVVAPRIEAGDDREAEAGPAAAETLFEYVRHHVLPHNQVGLVHGRMNSEQQQRVMSDFRTGRLQLLVCTTVIEVGLDVPEATVILIEDAQRFGLAQLHQLRGRVGRGKRPGLCLLVAGGDSLERLNILGQCHDGFTLAEEDLKLRGPGDATGLKQTGLPPLIWARLPRDLPLLLQARETAEEILSRDPDLQDPGFKLVAEILELTSRHIQAELAEVG